MRGSSEDLIKLAASRLNSATHDGSRAASKYDFVKVRVWLGEDMAHYYVLSRFLMSRMLTVTKVPSQKAIKIALEVKKYLVDNDRLDVRQDELEAILFSVMRGKGFGDEFIDRYNMVNQFFQQKRPLIILICGSACTGKSTFAQHLASRLNLPNVLQTDILYELLRTSEWGQLSSTPLWSREGLGEEELVSEFQEECRIVRRGLEGDLCKCIKDGKPIIIEGLHLDPGLYLDEFGRHGCIGMGGTESMDFSSETASLLGAQHAQQAQQVQQQATASYSVMGSAADSLPASPISPSGLFCALGSELGDGTASPNQEGSLLAGPSSSEPYAVTGLGPSAPNSPAATGEEPLLPTRRSASFNDAAASGLAYTSPSYSNSSPWRYLHLPGSFLQRLLQRPGSAKHPPPPPSAAPLRQLQSLPAHACSGAASAVVTPAVQRLRAHPFARTASAGQVTFMLQQPEDLALAPTPVMPGTEVVVQVPGPPTLSPASELALPAEKGSSLSPATESSVHQKLWEAEGPDGAAGGPGLAARILVAPCQPAEAWREEGAGQAASSTQPSLQQQGPPASGANAAAPRRGLVDPAARLSDSSVAAAGAAAAPPEADAAPAAGGDAAAVPAPVPVPSEPQQGPVFVPLVLSMEERDYELVIQEWLAAQAAYSEVPSSGGDEAGEGHDAAAAVLRRLQVLQAYLNSYRAVGVPVVEVGVGNFTETLNKLHDYLLQCIRMSV